MLSLVRRLYPGDSWQTKLPPERLAEASIIYEDRVQRNTAIDLASCLQLGDKKRIILSHEEVQTATGLSKSKFKDLIEKLRGVRDEIAHSNPVTRGGWVEVYTMAESGKAVIRCIDEFLGSQ